MMGIPIAHVGVGCALIPLLVYGKLCNSTNVPLMPLVCNEDTYLKALIPIEKNIFKITLQVSFVIGLIVNTRPESHAFNVGPKSHT